MRNIYQEYLNLKNQETVLKGRREELEAEIYEKFQDQIEKKIKGATTVEDNGYTITVTRNLVRKFDQESLHRLNTEKKLPFKTEFKIGEKDLDDLDANLAVEVLECSTTQYNKPSFKIVLEK